MTETKTLNDILTPERRREGWSVRYEGEGTLAVLYQGKVRARFNQTKVTIENLEHEIGEVSKN
jgi:hypothetical protein